MRKGQATKKRTSSGRKKHMFANKYILMIQPTIVWGMFNNR